MHLRGPNEKFGEEIGYRMPTLEGLKTAFGSGAWIAVAYCDAVATAPGAPGSTGKWL